jgi:hypothetical protein
MDKRRENTKQRKPETSLEIQSKYLSEQVRGIVGKF